MTRAESLAEIVSSVPGETLTAMSRLSRRRTAKLWDPCMSLADVAAAAYLLGVTDTAMALDEDALLARIREGGKAGT